MIKGFNLLQSLRAVHAIWSDQKKLKMFIVRNCHGSIWKGILACFMVKNKGGTLQNRFLFFVAD